MWILFFLHTIFHKQVIKCIKGNKGNKCIKVSITQDIFISINKLLYLLYDKNFNTKNDDF